MQTLIILLGTISVLLGSIVCATLWRGFVATKLWAWFIVPQFGLAPLPLSIAIGLSALVSIYSGSYRTPPKSEEKSLAPLVMIFLQPALALLLGFIVLQFR